jgi:multidrug efflux system membrane fusion protein
MPYAKVKSRAFVFVLASMAAAVASTFMLVPESRVAKADSRPQLVRVARARRQDFEMVKNVIGTVLASGQVNIQAQISGKLLAARFSEGQRVRSGDVLFEIDPRPAQAALQQAEATLAKDMAVLANAENDARRYAALLAADAISSQQRDQALAAAKSDKAVVDADAAAVALARLNLEYTEIHSPVDGKTGAILVQPGNIVSGGQGANTLVTVTELQPVKISFSLPQSEIGLVLGQAQGNAVRIAYTVDHQARFAEANFVDSDIDAQSGTVEFRATVANRDLGLWPGETIDARVILRTLRHAIVVDREAVNSGPDGDYVYAVDKSGEVARIPVAVLGDDGSRDAISGGVDATALLVTEGQFRLAPGMRVAVMSQPARSVSVSGAGTIQ